jgi:hypothetical protein
MAIRINFITQFDNRGIKRAQRELADVGRNISRALDVAVIGGLAAATTGLVSAIKSASNFAAEYEGVSQVFGNAAKAVQDFAKEASRTAGLSQTEALQASKVFGLFASKAGLSAESAASFSTTLVQLAGDLGSFNDVPTEEALAAIQSGLQGQAEPLRKFGVFLDDAALKEEALAMKIYEGTGALSAQQKMMASYSLILKQTNIQQGDYLKYADTFGNSTKTITKDLANLQVELGQAVLPAIESLLPAVRDLIPVFGTQLKEAIASVDWKAFFKILVDGITFLITYGPQLAGLATTMFAVSKAFAAADIATKLFAVSAQMATGKVAIFNAVMNANPILRVISLLGLLAVALAGVGIASQQAGSRIPTAVTSRAMKAGQEAADAAAKRFKAGTKEQGAAVAAARKQAYDQVLKNYQFGLDQQLAASLAVPTTSEIVVPPTGTGAVNSLKKTSDAAKKAADEAQKAIDAQDELVADFTKNILELSEAFRGLGDSTKELGQFEQQASSAFDALNEQIKKGLNDRAITQAAAKYLNDYVAVERAALTALARQRDVLLSRIAIAKDISRGVVDAVNITGLLTNETRQVTKSVKTLVNGIATTISSTYDEVVTGNLADSFKKLVDRTKNFAKNLITLKKLGLNGTLFKQIVDAGSEAGGATAEAIIAGGADTVTELNGLFDELNKAGSDIAAESTDVFYDLGEGVSNAFIDGLKSQEAILAAQIASMVAGIEAAFASMMARLNQLGAAPMTNANGFAYETALPGVSGSAMQFGSATPWAQAVASFRESQTPTVNNYITVKAGAIVAEKSAGQLITSLQNKYTKASG